MTDLISIVKENLPYNVSLIREPYKVRLSEYLLYVHGDIGYVFHIKTVFDDVSYHEEMLFVSYTKNNAFHSAISLFGKSIEELSKRCYWVDEKDIVKEVFTV